MKGKLNLNVLLISPKSTSAQGGIAIWTNHFLSHCGDHGIDCKLVNTELIGNRSVNGTARRNFIDEIKRTCRILNNLSTSLKSNAFDVVHLNTSCGQFGLFRDYLIAKQIKNKGIRLITHFHCDIPYWIHNPLSKKCLKALVSISDNNFVLCENSRVYLKQNFGVEAQKMPNFIDDSLIRKEEKHISETISTAFFVGRVEEAKGAREIYEFAQQFSNISFKLAGNVDEIVRMWDKPENVLLLGPLDHENVIREMDNADIFIFPSHTEGFSLALTEAMARGLPIIATDVGAARDMLDDCGGIVVNVGDVSNIIKSVDLLKDAEKRKVLSRNYVDKVMNTYTSEAVINRMLDFYRQEIKIL